MKPDLALRVVLTISGILAGLAGWLLVDVLPDYLRDNFRLLMTLGIFAGLFFSVFMVAAGPLRPAAAFLAALIVAVPASLLFLWASFRYGDPGAFLESGLPIVALIFGTGIAVPFTITFLARRGPSRSGRARSLDRIQACSSFCYCACRYINNSK
jgi:hypothetical protein